MARIPINLVTGELQAESLPVGIDLGTTHSLIARVVDGMPETIADVGRTSLVPSVVTYRPGGDVVVGDDALPHLTTAPGRTFYSVKRLMGRSYTDAATEQTFLAYPLHDAGADHMVSLAVDGRLVSPVEISAHILRELKTRAEHRLKTPVVQAVITVPAYFNDAQRQATRDAGQMAGLEVLRIINEPTAAALAYGLGQPDAPQTIAVYDLGGGTFDITILQVEGGVFEVLATHGDTHLGGDDIDLALVHHWLPQLGLTPQDLAQHPPLQAQLRLLAEGTKKALSHEKDHTLTVDLAGLGMHTLTMSRTALEELIQPLIHRTLQACARALKDASLTAQQITHVVLVGGSTRVPAVKEAVGQFFSVKPYEELNPDEVVALGAAVQADILTRGRTDVLLLDVTPLSMGIETAGGLMDVLIHRNGKIPTRATRNYTTQVDGQVNIRISVFQGERELVADNRKLAEFDLRGIPAMPAGLPKVEVAFLLDADGILKVSARELRSGVYQQIEVKPTYGLSDDQVEQMLMASVTHAQEDVSARMLAEARQEGRQMVYTARSFLKKYHDLLNEEEIRQTEQLADALEGTLIAPQKEAIREATDALEAYTRPFAERVMDRAVHAALVGKKMES